MKGEGFIMNITDVRVRRVAKEGKMKAVPGKNYGAKLHEMLLLNVSMLE